MTDDDAIRRIYQETLTEIARAIIAEPRDVGDQEVQALMRLFEQRGAAFEDTPPPAGLLAAELAFNAMLRMKQVLIEERHRALTPQASQAVEKIKSDLAYRLPTSGRPMKHVVLERDLGEALLHAIEFGP